MLIAVDTGGTKTLVASFNRDGVLGEQIKFPTPSDPQEYIKILKSVLKETFGKEHVDAIVVGCPGVMNDGVVLWAGGNLSWKNFHIASLLKGVLGDNVPVLVENDANLAGLAETRMLKKIPYLSLYVTISTGIGTGVIIDGHIEPGLRNSEAGHALIEYDGIVREWETFASGKAIYKTYNKYARDITSKRAWDQIADRISRGFLAVIPIMQPDLVIIGGSIGTYFEKYSEQLSKILKEKLPEHIPCPKFVAAKHPEQAVIYGCYYYALDNIDHISIRK